MTYSEFETRWKTSGGAELSNYGLFIQDLCDLLGVPRPDPKTDNPAHDAYVLERAVQFNDGGKKSTGRIDLYKRGCFILETKQGVNGFVDLLDQDIIKTAGARERGSAGARERGSAGGSN